MVTISPYRTKGLVFIIKMDYVVFEVGTKSLCIMKIKLGLPTIKLCSIMLNKGQIYKEVQMR